MPKRNQDDLGIEDTSGLTDADWAEINKLKQARDSGGQDAVTAAFKALDKRDPACALKILFAFDPVRIREAMRDAIAEIGWTEEDLREMAESATRKQ